MYTRSTLVFLPYLTFRWQNFTHFTFNYSHSHSSDSWTFYLPEIWWNWVKHFFPSTSYIDQQQQQQKTVCNGVNLWLCSRNHTWWSLLAMRRRRFLHPAVQKAGRLWCVEESAFRLHMWNKHWQAGTFCSQRLTSWETFPKTLKKQGSSDCVADEVTVWIKTPAIEKKREEEKPSQPFAAWFWSGFGASRNSDYAKIAFETIDFVEKRKMKKLYHFISNPIMCLCMLPLAGTAGCNMAEHTEW